MSNRDVGHGGQPEDPTPRREGDPEKRAEELEELLRAARRELRAKESRLRESERRFRITFERAAVGMAHVAPRGRWLRVNEKLCELVGYAREELLGLTFADITHPDDLGADLEHVRKMLRGEIRTYSMDKRYVKKDGSRFWVRLSVSLVRSPSGEPEYFISVIEDITTRKLEELVPDPLTGREAEVLRLVAEGWTNLRIAGRLAYSEATVKLHVRRVLVKLGVKTRAEAAHRAVEIGLIPPPRSANGRVPPENAQNG